MHYVAITAGILLVCLAYGVHAETFGAAFDAATSGEPVKAVELLGDALSGTLRDADTKH